MRKLVPVLILLSSLLACRDSVQNSDKQKDMTRGSGPENGTSATDQQNYGAGKNASNSNAQKDPGHTDNLTNSPGTVPNPQTSGNAATGSTGTQEQVKDSSQNPSRKQSGARNNPK
jgi:hypothetical protein